jgi:membrane protease YdiL (CAAX protease family)
MVIFILGVNLLSAGHMHKKRISDKKEKSISLMTFKDMGITEGKVKLFFESKRPGAIFFRYAFFTGFFMLIAGILVNIIFLFRSKRVVPKKVPEKKPVSWGIADIFRVIIIVVFSGYVLSAIGAAIFRQFYSAMDVNLHMLLGTFFIDITAGAAIFYFVLVRYKQRLSSLGIYFSDFYRNILSGITAYIFILPFLIITLIISILFFDAIGYKPPPQPVFDMFIEEKRNSVILFLTIFVSALGPVVEEIFFRGFLYSAVRKRFGVFIGVLLSAGLFSILHTNAAGFLPIMILGALMAFLYEITGSLIAPMTVHILHNSIIVGFVFFIKELLK